MWEITNDYICGKSLNFKFKHKIASFDLDGTLIKTKSGKTFPVSHDDWKYYSENVVSLLSSLYNDNYCLIIISNQSRVTNSETQQKFKNKIEQILGNNNFEYMFFCSIKKNIYRKPLPNFFYDFVTSMENVDFVKSFYCGDACGRKNDFSDTDLKFALNCKLKFLTPEMLFLNRQEQIPQITYPNTNCKKHDFLFTPSTFPELIILVGCPASGKSTISNILSEKFNYKIINQDTLKTKAKCIKCCYEFMNLKYFIVIDATNPTVDCRKEWIVIAKQHNYKTRVMLMTTPREICYHNNQFRMITTGKNISEIVYRTYFSKYQIPKKSEGIEQILNVNILEINVNQKINKYDYMWNMYLY